MQHVCFCFFTHKAESLKQLCMQKVHMYISGLIPTTLNMVKALASVSPYFLLRTNHLSNTCSVHNYMLLMYTHMCAKFPPDWKVLKKPGKIKWSGKVRERFCFSKKSKNVREHFFKCWLSWKFHFMLQVNVLQNAENSQGKSQDLFSDFFVQIFG